MSRLEQELIQLEKFIHQLQTEPGLNANCDGDILKRAPESGAKVLDETIPKICTGLARKTT
jgi:hypothetical protein